jgi:hypothetical protein
MTDAIDWTRFTSAVEGKTVLVPSVAFELFLNLTDDGGLIDFYDRCREALGDRITHYQAQSMNAFRLLDKRGNAKVHTWFTNPQRVANYYLYMSEGDWNEQATASRIQLDVVRRSPDDWAAIEAREVALRQKAVDENRWVPPLLASRLRVTLPLDHPLAAPDRFAAWVLGFQLVRAWPFASGYAGYALNFYGQAALQLYQPAQRFLAEACSKFPGFDWDGGGLIPRILRYRPESRGFLPLVKRANCLNLVSGDAVEALGGPEHVRERLQSDASIRVTAMQGGLAVQAGDAPQIGDGERDALRAYRNVARVLRPVRIEEIDGLGASFMAKATNEWLNALDRDAPTRAIAS